MELADSIDLEIYHGPGLDWKYGNTIKDGQEFKIGALRIKAIHTPGHTDESTCYIIYDTTSGEEPVMVFTGDILFVGSTGRIDMYGPDHSKRLAGNLFESIFTKLLPLGDQTIILPGHGAGSVCGAAINEREQSTIGLERKQNSDLQFLEKEDFINNKLKEHHYYVPYFQKMEIYNLEGPPLLKNTPRFKPFLVKDFKGVMDKKEGIILDIRDPESFGAIHIPKSYNIWLEGLPSHAGWIIPYDKPLLLIVKDFKNLKKAHEYLLRLGYDNIDGYLIGGIKAWYNQNHLTDSIGLLTVADLKKKIDGNENVFILDVRSETERKDGYIENSNNIYLGEIENKIEELPHDKPIITVCGNGSRASLAASILRRHGFTEIYTVLGSMRAWNNAGYPVI